MRYTCIHAFAALFALLSVAAPQDVAAQGKKVRLIIVSAMEPELLDAFYDEVSKHNSWIDAHERPQTERQADAIVYFLNTWSDAKDAPGLADSAQLLAEIDALAPETFRHEITLTFDDGKSLPLVFYALEPSGYQPLTCYAQDIAVVMKNGETVLDGSCAQE